MKIIYICNFAANYGGNFLASLHDIAGKLVNKKIKVCFIFPRDAQKKNWEINLDEFEVRYADFFNGSSILNDIKKTICENCIIHTHFLNERTFLELGLSLNKLEYRNLKLIYHEHMFPKVNFKHKLIDHIGDILLPNSYYIGVSQAVYVGLRKLHFESRTFLLTNAIDTKRLHFKINKSNNNIIIFSSAYFRKGTDLAVEAINSSSLKDKVNLIIVTHNTNQAKSIIMKKYKIIPKFIKIILPYNNIADLYDNSFLFLSPSRSEAFGYANLEAAYSGKQVIASDIPGQNILKSVPYITWIESNNIDELRVAINNAYKSKNLDTLQRHSLENKKFIDENYSLKEWSNKLMKIYGIKKIDFLSFRGYMFNIF